jgi:protoporphyrin/coproporphyrin ferrochelatase
MNLKSKLIVAALATFPLAQQQVVATERKVGILFASYGDVDKPEEVENYVKSAIRDPDVSPIPFYLKGIVAELGWLLQGKSAAEEYRVIGGSNYRASSRAQADMVQKQLANQGLEAKTYIGFVFTYPYIRETMAKIQEDGITDLVLFYQGGQYSKVTQYINVREVKTYLKNHPEYTPRVTVVKSFSDDPRFRDLLADSISKGVSEFFPGEKPSDVCVYLPAHGLPMYLPENGDPAFGQMIAAYKDMKARFPEHLVVTGYQNHAELGAKWTLPDSDEQAHWLAAGADCPNVFISGRISFTIDNIETLYDEAVGQRETILKARPDTKVAVQKAFNSEPDFVNFLAELSIEALNGIGDLEVIDSESTR